MENTFCRTCEVSFTSESHAVSHYNGKKHKKRVDYSRPRPAGTRQNRFLSPSTNEEAAAAQAPPLNPETNQSGESSPSSTRSQDDSHDIPNESGHLYYCNVCSKNFSGPAPMKQHMQGSAHEKQSRKVRKIASLAKLEDEDLSPQFKPQSTSLKFTRREYTPSPDGLKQELLQNMPTFSRYAKEPIISHKPRHEGMRSGNFCPEKMGMIRSELIQMCIEKMKLEIFRVIPSIAESVVDAVLEIYPNGKMEQEETRQDEDGRMKSQKNTISPHPQTETKEGDDEEGDDEEETSQSSFGGLFNQEQAQKEMEPAISDKKGSCPGPDQFLSDPVDDSLGHRGEVEDLQVENDLDGSNCLQSHRINQTLNFSNIKSGGCRASSSYYEEQVEVNYETQGGHTGQSLEEALNRDQDTVEKQFGFREEMEERYSSVTSQDLIQLEEPSSVENEQHHSAVSTATRVETPDEEVYSPVSPKACEKRSISLDERRLTTAHQLESGPPGLQKRETRFAADESQGELYPREPPLDGESSDVSDLMTVVTEIIQALDFQAGEGGSQNLVHALPTEGAMCSLQPDK